MKNKFLIFMATITFFLTVAVVGILLKPELYESKTTVIKENDSMQSEVDEKNIESKVSNQEEWGSGDVYDALDSKGVEMVKCILQQEKERGALIVLTCHDYSVLKELSDSIYFIEEGRVVGYERQ